MIKIWKEIRIVGLKFFVNGEQELDDRLIEIESNRLGCIIVYDKSNTHDPDCMIARIGHTVLGYVDFVDKRYIKYILDKNGFCNAGFKEIYRGEKTPIVRFVASVELDKVDEIVAGKDWDKWCYYDHTLKMPQEWNDTDYSAKMIIEMLNDASRPIDTESMDPMVELLCESCNYDMSVELTRCFDAICCCLESIHTVDSDRWKNKLQRASTKRRQDKSRALFIKEWLPSFMSSDLCARFFDEYNMFLLSTKSEYDKPVEKADYIAERHHIENVLRNLPYNLYYHINNYSELYASSFYTAIPREKQLQLLSVLIIREYLDSIIKIIGSTNEQRMPFGHPSFNVYGRIGSMFVGENAVFKGNLNVSGDLLSDSATKITR